MLGGTELDGAASGVEPPPPPPPPPAVICVVVGVHKELEPMEFVATTRAEI